MTQVSELSGKDFRAASVKCSRKTILKTTETDGKTQNFSKEMEYINKWIF